MAEKISLKAGDSRKIALEIPAGWYVGVFFTTQAAYEWRVVIGDGGSPYFDHKRKSTDPNPPIYGFFYALSNNLTVEISVSQSPLIRLHYERMNVSADSGEVVAKTITFAGEDSTDQDYNDLSLSITAWKKRG
ncbi:MAG: hypothetical protein LBC51_06900 [Treponema sp.]|jgi:hypothetical protein|nr:hypothetical protein [Treponema sp.]